MSDASFRRCRHIITDNARVREARSAMFAGDPIAFGKLMLARPRQRARRLRVQLPKRSTSSSKPPPTSPAASELDSPAAASAAAPSTSSNAPTRSLRRGPQIRLQTALRHRRRNLHLRRRRRCLPPQSQAAHLRSTGTIDEQVFLESPHRRWNPLKREWVVVSPHRTQRPWQGQTEDTAQPPSLALRSHLLPLPRQHPRRRPSHPRLHRHLRLRKRLRRTHARRPRTPSLDVDNRRPPPRRNRAWPLPRPLLRSPPRPHPRHHAASPPSAASSRCGPTRQPNSAPAPRSTTSRSSRTAAP